MKKRQPETPQPFYILERPARSHNITRGVREIAKQLRSAESDQGATVSRPSYN